jgi:hypothetical protein
MQLTLTRVSERFWLSIHDSRTAEDTARELFKAARQRSLPRVLKARTLQASFVWFQLGQWTSTSWGSSPWNSNFCPPCPLACTVLPHDCQITHSHQELLVWPPVDYSPHPPRYSDDLLTSAEEQSVRRKSPYLELRQKGPYSYPYCMLQVAELLPLDTTGAATEPNQDPDLQRAAPTPNPLPLLSFPIILPDGWIILIRRYLSAPPPPQWTLHQSPSGIWTFP